MRLSLLLFSTILVAVGCGDDADGLGPIGVAAPTGPTADDGSDGGSVAPPAAPSGPSVNADAGTGSQRPAQGCERMDILFVVDNSGSMAEEQMNLAQNFPRFIEVLDAFKDGNLDYRVGVTTTAFGAAVDLGVFGNVLPPAEEGALLQTDGMSNPWLDRGDANLTETFTEIATVGTDGSGMEQPLRAAQSALVDRVDDGTNSGFHRADALLAIVVLTDEDDGSTSEGDSGGGGGFLGGLFPNPAPVMGFVESFDAVAMGRDRWATAVIAGDQQPQCSSEFGDATYAERLVEFVDLVGDNAVFGSICSGDLSTELDKALNTFTTACDAFVPVI